MMYAHHFECVNSVILYNTSYNDAPLIHFRTVRATHQLSLRQYFSSYQVDVRIAFVCKVIFPSYKTYLDTAICILVAMYLCRH